MRRSTLLLIGAASVALAPTASAGTCAALTCDTSAGVACNDYLDAFQAVTRITGPKSTLGRLRRSLHTCQPGVRCHDSPPYVQRQIKTEPAISISAGPGCGGLYQQPCADNDRHLSHIAARHAAGTTIGFDFSHSFSGNADRSVAGKMRQYRDSVYTLGYPGIKLETFGGKENPPPAPPAPSPPPGSNRDDHRSCVLLVVLLVWGVGVNLPPPPVLCAVSICLRVYPTTHAMFCAGQTSTFGP